MGTRISNMMFELFSDKKMKVLIYIIDKEALIHIKLRQ